jgi:tRNA A-37 threonylcarbamoyl transferase component Bud32
MRWSRLERLFDRVARIGAHPAETEDERVRRLIWMGALLVGAIPVSASMAPVFALVGAAPAAILAAVGAAFWASQILLVSLLRRGVDSMALASQLSCVVFSCAGVLVMGGLSSSGGIVLIGLIGPMYALAFPSRTRAWWMLGAYMASLALALAVGDGVPWARPLPDDANRVIFAVMVTTTAVSVFGALYFFVLQRDRALRLLHEAEDKIARLLQASPGASDTVPGWSRSMAAEIADAIGAERIGIWEVGANGLVPIAADGLASPSVDDVDGLAAGPEGTFARTSQGVLVPVRGMSGELCGALVVAGATVRWTQTERRLVGGFAHQLGAALAMARMRLRLAAADQRRALTRQELQERGIATLQICRRCGRCYDHGVSACAHDGSALESPRTLPYRLLDRYRFTRVIGEGGMGIVLAAWDERLQRDVAVKLIRADHFNNPDLRERFEREARAIARIQHPGVIALYDSGELDDGTAVLVMERLTGCDLWSQLRDHGRGTPAQVAELVRQGCAALRAAHRAGVVHRDVKPENIFLVNDATGFRVKILDFGVAKSLVFERGLTQAGMVMGTPTYMSPEQVQGEDVDTRTDVYAFAAVCYEALTGERAVTGDDLGGILINVLNTVPAPPSSLVPGLPPEVDAAFESALAKDRSRRLKEIELWGSSFVESLARVEADRATKGWPFPRESSPTRDEANPGEGVTMADGVTRPDLDGFSRGVIEP